MASSLCWLFSFPGWWGLALRSRTFFAVLVRLRPRDKHLAGVNAHVNSCAIGPLPLHALSAEDTFLLETCGTRPVCCPLQSPCTVWTASSFQMGTDRTLYFCLGSLERGEDMILLRVWEGTSKCLLRTVLQSEVTKELNSTLATVASGTAVEGKSFITS